MTEDERETEDKCGKRNKRRQRILAIEYQQADEDNSHKSNTHQYRVQLENSRVDILVTAGLAARTEAAKHIYLDT